MVAKFQQEILRGTFFFTCCPRFFKLPLLNRTIAPFPRMGRKHWNLKVVSLGPLGASKMEGVAPNGFKKRMEPTESWIWWRSCSEVGQLKPRPFEACPTDMSFSKATDLFFCLSVFLYMFGHIWIWWITVITQEQDFDWRFTITAAEFQSHSRTSLPKSSPCCFVNHVSSSCGDCMTLRY